MENLKTFEEWSFDFSKKEKDEMTSRAMKRASDMIELDKKNIDLETKVTEEDPYGEERWEVGDKSEEVKNNLYKVLTDRIGNFKQKPIYDVFIKCNSGNYFLIGDIRYFQKIVDNRTKEEIEKDDNEMFQNMLKSLPKSKQEAFTKWYKDFIEKRDSGKIPHLPFIVYFYLDRLRKANQEEIDKMEKMTKDEIKYLFEKELNRQIYSGDLRTDININLTYVDKLYHLIKDK
jgi:hypothetical protein